MKKIIGNKFIMFLLVLGLIVRAQEAIPTTGGNAIGIGGTSSYAIGQVVYTNQSGLNGSVAQGVEQAYEISVTLELKEAKGIAIQCIAYPNPTSKNVTLKIENYDITNLSYLIFDLNGKIILNNKISSNETSIPMENFVANTYFIKIMNLHKELKVFKIIKKD